MDFVYIDNNATTKIAPEVLEVMKPYLTKFYANPSSMHRFGGMLKKKIEHARHQIASLLGAHEEEIIFTSCGTESNSTAILSALQSDINKKHIITTMVEHPSIKNLCESLINFGYKITFVPVDTNGKLDIDYLYSSISNETVVVSIMWANNETGVIFPVEEIAEELYKKKIIFHTDAVQVVGKLPINMLKNKISMLSLSGHKIHAPKGVGALYIRKNIKFKPFLIGGHQENSRRSGTENVASIIGFGKAAELSNAIIKNKNNNIIELRNKLENEIVKKIPGSFINGFINKRLPNTTSICFEYVEGESILLMLDEYGICASSGSACTSGSLEPSHVLKAMKVPFKAAHGSIRFSLSIYNTLDEINYIIEKTPKIIKTLRKISPFWNK